MNKRSYARGVALLALISSAEHAAAQGTWRAERTKRGDTSIVRTVSGSVWPDTMTFVREIAIGALDGADPFVFSGDVRSVDVDGAGNIYVLDSKAREVRVFSSRGAHVRTFGRRGGGPGEFEMPHFLRVLSDGRSVVRDNPGRFSVFSAEGAYVTGWIATTGFASGDPFFLTTSGRIFNPTFMNRWVWYDLTARASDTIRILERGPPTPMLEIRSPGGGVARYSIAYLPSTVWTLTDDGRMVSGYSSRYEIDIAKPDGAMLRIARSVAPIPVPAGESRQYKEAYTRRFRRSDPNWTWNGPEIPKTKPLFDAVHVGRDGSIWVLRQGPSREVSNPQWDALRPGTGFPTYWTSSMTADVFDADGRFLGVVKPPERMQWYPAPVLSATTVWALTMHADDFLQAVRYGVAKR